MGSIGAGAAGVVCRWSYAGGTAGRAGAWVGWFVVHSSPARDRVPVGPQPPRPWPYCRLHWQSPSAAGGCGRPLSEPAPGCGAGGVGGRVGIPVWSLVDSESRRHAVPSLSYMIGLDIDFAHNVKSSTRSGRVMSPGHMLLDIK